ncbi:hypothetical protein BS78_02G217000 [Paspalum vaginatum]|nr:hypothetical protein BS78_02G217000 [Paspalum vaginatum]
MAGFAPLLVLVLAAASCSALVLGGASSAPSPSRPAAVFDVGEARGWAVPPANDANALNKWAMSHRFHVGDVLDFKYADGDSVLLVRRGDYDGCRAASPVRRFADAGDDTRFRLDRLGLFYFISGVPARCEAGQRMVLLVVDARSSLGGSAPTPAPAPAPATVEDGPSDDRPVPVPFRLFVAAGLGFVGGCIGAGLIIILLCVITSRR